VKAEVLFNALKKEGKRSLTISRAFSSPNLNRRGVRRGSPALSFSNETTLKEDGADTENENAPSSNETR
jgi:hypothetical protein